MKKIILLMMLFLGVTFVYSQNTQSLVSSNEKETVIKFSLENYDFQAVQTQYGEEFLIDAPNTSSIMLAEAPDLLKMTASIIIPDNGRTKVEVISEKYQDFYDIAIAPSKGNLTRDIDPSSVEYTHGKYYNNSTFFPGKIADANSPYIMRDYRGQAVNVYPFQYNPTTKTLRVYSEIVVKVTNIELAGTNEFVRQKSFDKVSYEFNQVYKNHFLNFDNSKYTPVEEEGNMLIICHDDWTDEMQDFVDWKNTIGRQCEIVTVTDAGGTASAIATYVETYYNDNGLAYLLLVGDAAQVPTNSGVGLGGDSDNAYAYILGDDHYLDFFVGRFSAESAADVETQVARTITYENGSTLAADWLNVSMGVTSDQGPGDDNEMDYEHYRNMAIDLLAFTYDTSLELFDGSQGGDDASGSPTPAMVGSEIDGGVGIINYTGHGSDISWGSSGYSVSDINNLTNDNMLPFIWSVACVNGNFVGQTCFGEAWLRATNGSEPTGAIGIMASTINQSWAPPMAAQDEMVDILVESYDDNIKRTFAGLSINGCHLMNDETSDFAMTDTWTCFGDPSFLVRTDNPSNMSITHDDAIIMGSVNFPVNCDLDGALATISKDGGIIGSAYVSGGSAIVPLDGINPGDEVTVAVVGFNRITYLSNIMVIAPSGPYVAFTNFDINGETSIDYGATENLNVNLTNYGPAAAPNVTATITSDDEYITLTNNENISFGNITEDGGTASASDFLITVANNAPDQYVATLNIDITSTNKETWTSTFNVTINAPVLSGEFDGVLDEADNLAFSSSPVTLVDTDADYSYSITVSTLGGNDNGLLDAGENVVVTFNSENVGHAGISNVYAYLSTTSEYVTINNAESYIGSIAVGETFASDFNIEVSATAPVGTMAEFEFVFGNGQYKDTLEHSLPIGLIIEDFESGDFSSYAWDFGGDADWTIDGDSYEGDNSAKSGTITDNQSSELSYTCNVTADGTITFWSKVDSENNYDYLIFYIDGSEEGGWSGDVSWEEHTYNVTAGNHTFKWAYEKDGSVTNGADCAWVDYITFPGHTVAKKGAKSITITSETTLPTWLDLLDNGDGTAMLSGTTPSTNEDVDVTLFATTGTYSTTQEFTIKVGVTSIYTIDNVVKFYPNPTTNVLNIDISNISESANVFMTDITGKVILTKELTYQVTQIDLSNLARGIYLLNLEIDGEIYQNKIIKE